MTVLHAAAQQNPPVSPLSITLPAVPRAMVYDTHRERLLVSGCADDGPYVVAIAAPTWQAIPLPGTCDASGNALLATSAYIYRTEMQAGTLSRFTPDGVRLGEIYLGQFPGSLVPSSDGALAFALTGCERYPGVHDTGSALHMIPLDTFSESRVRTTPLPESDYGEARAICIGPDMVYVAASPSDYGAATILAIDRATGLVRHQQTHSGFGFWVSPDCLALSAKGEPIMAIDGPTTSQLVCYTRDLTVRRSIDLGLGPTCVVTAPSGKQAAVASRGASCLRLLDLTTFGLTPPAPSPVECPRLLAFDATGRHLFVAGSFTPELAIVDTSQLQVSPVPDKPSPQREERILLIAPGEEKETLWAVRPDGTDCRAVFHLPEKTYAAELSPDGTRIATTGSFENVPDLVVFDLITGERRRLTYCERDRGDSCIGITDRVRWLPHGRALVYATAHGLYETKLFVVAADGGPSYPLLNNFDDRDMEPTPHPWDPDRLLFLFDAGNWTFDREIRLFDRGSACQWTLLPSNGRTDTTPLWHPNGKAIYWTQGGTEIRSPATAWSMASDGANDRPVASGPEEELPEAYVYAMSPDGDHILCCNHDPEDSTISIVDLQSGAMTPFTAAPPNAIPVDWGLVAWPPTVQVPEN